MKTIVPARLLSTALLLDALVSGAVALLHATWSAGLAELTRLPQALLLGSGVFLLGYVLLLALMARSRRLPTALLGLVIVGNVLWALGCFALLGAPGLQPSPLGVAWLLVHAATVLFFAALEFAGWRASAPAPGAARPA